MKDLGYVGVEDVIGVCNPIYNEDLVAEDCRRHFVRED